MARAERERERYDPDAAFIFYWIAFNAVYADDSPETYDLREGENSQIISPGLVSWTPIRDVFNAIWKEHNRSIRDLLGNQFVYKPFWMGAYDSGELRFENDANRLEDAIISKQTDTMLRPDFRAPLCASQSAPARSSNLAWRDES